MREFPRDEKPLLGIEHDKVWLDELQIFNRVYEQYLRLMRLSIILAGLALIKTLQVFYG